MKKLQFPIIAIPYCDYGSRLAEVRKLAAGTVVTLKPDPNNPADTQAVKACIGMDHLGYVKDCKPYKLQALSCIGSRRGIRCRLLKIEEEHLILWVETELQFDPEKLTAPEPANKPFLSGWHYDGPLLPLTKEEKKLQDARDNLIIGLGEAAPDEEALEEAMAYLEKWAWIDVSMEAKNDMIEISDLLFELGMSRMRDRMERLLAVQVTPDMLVKQVARLRPQASSQEAAAIAKTMRRENGRIDDMLPAVVLTQMETDPGAIFSQLWYAPKPQEQVRALRTLLCLKMIEETTTSTTTTTLGICPYVATDAIKSPEVIDSELRLAAQGKAPELVDYVKKALKLGYLNFGNDDAKTVFRTLTTYYEIHYGYHNWLKYYGK